ncbi:MAG: hypothetical protein ACRDND_08625 [Streptosporangiaceae bacterium]
MSQLADCPEIPDRAAHVTHALMEAWSAAGGSAPVTTAEVCEYDSEALTPRHTAAALIQARRLGLANGGRGLWFATDRAWAIRRVLEDRFLAEVA